jgi:hypothetical protein
VNRKQATTNVLALLFALLLTGCVTTANMYEGPELPRNKIAVVTMGMSLGVLTVDGVKGQGTMTLKVLPGKHTITLFYGDGSRKSTASQTVTFIAEAGRSYHINANVTGSTWRPTVVEIDEK